MHESIFIGWDPREAAAFAVARHSAWRHMTRQIPIYGLVLDDLISKGLYRRPTTRKINGEGRFEMVDLLSVRSDYDGRVATQHANARFWTVMLAKRGWALFMDGDILVRGDLSKVFEGLDPSKAVYCVKHAHVAKSGVKMDGQLQTNYGRKNWSSFMILNCDHPANGALTSDVLNSAPGRELHRFFWLADCDIGELDIRWNWLVGESPAITDPKVVHFTSGLPDMPGYENVAFAGEWRAELNKWAA